MTNLHTTKQEPVSKSYTVDLHPNGGVILRPTYWSPGYTNGHRATPLEALQVAREQAEAALQSAQYHLDKIQELEEAYKD